MKLILCSLIWPGCGTAQMKIIGFVGRHQSEVIERAHLRSFLAPHAPAGLSFLTAKKQMPIRLTRTPKFMSQKRTKQTKEEEVATRRHCHQVSARQNVQSSASFSSLTSVRPISQFSVNGSESTPSGD